MTSQAGGQRRPDDRFVVEGDMRSVRVIRPEPRRSRLLLAAGGVLAQAGLSGQVWAPDRSLPWFIAGLAWLAAPMAALIVGLCLHLRANTEAGTAGATGPVRGHGNRAGGSAGVLPGLMAVPQMMLTAWYLGCCGRCGRTTTTVIRPRAPGTLSRPRS
jgi:hypothetical protein